MIYKTQFLRKIHDAAEFPCWRNSKGYVEQIEIRQERKGLWHAVNDSGETAMSKVHMQYVISIIYKALPFHFLYQQSCLQAVWRVSLVHGVCCIPKGCNILLCNMILCHVPVSLPCLRCNAAGYIRCIQLCQEPPPAPAYPRLCHRSVISEHFVFFHLPILVHRVIGE